MNKLTFTKKPCCTATVYYYDKLEGREVEVAFINLDFQYLRTQVDYRNKSDDQLLSEFCQVDESDDDYRCHRVVRKEEWMDWPDQVSHPGQHH